MRILILAFVSVLCAVAALCSAIVDLYQDSALTSCRKSPPLAIFGICTKTMRAPEKPSCNGYKWKGACLPSL